MVATRTVTRGRLSRVDQLPANVRREVERMLEANATQVEIKAYLDSVTLGLGVPPIGRSLVNRYATRREHRQHRRPAAGAEEDHLKTQLELLCALTVQLTSPVENLQVSQNLEGGHDRC